MLCARECPDWCIYIDSHKETLPAVDGGRERQRNVLDRFAIDFSLCMYCGICIEVCPFDALLLVARVRVRRARHPRPAHEKDRLAGWMDTVPPPPAADARGAPTPRSGWRCSPPTAAPGPGSGARPSCGGRWLAAGPGPAAAV